MIYIYSIKNLINDKLYIGKHEGELNDSYMESGKVIRLAIKKYGKENFKKGIDMYLDDGWVRGRIKYVRKCYA